MAELKLNVGAARFNLERLRAASAPASKVMLVCKSDFYGLGLDVAAALEPSVDAFAVGSVDEALALEAVTASKEIVVLYPPTDVESLAALLATCVEHRRIVPTILPSPAHAAQLDSLPAAAPGPPLGCYVLVPQPGDRFWCRARFLEVLADLAERPQLALRGVFTHLAEAGALDDAELARRIEQFARDIEGLGAVAPLSVSDSHLAARRMGTQLGFCRVGLFPLGAVEPSAAQAYGLRSAMTLRAKVINSYRLPGPGRVGYCRRTLDGDAALAILDVGFASGLPLEFFRHCAATADDGREYRFLETPWMEYSCLLTGEALLPVGTELELFGERQSVYAQARCAGLPVEALFCHLARVTRRVVDA